MEKTFIFNFNLTSKGSEAGRRSFIPVGGLKAVVSRLIILPTTYNSYIRLVLSH